MFETPSEPVETAHVEAFAKLLGDSLALELRSATPGMAESATYLLARLASIPVSPDFVRDVLEGHIIPERSSKYRGLKRPEDRNRSMAFREQRIVASHDRLVAKRAKVNESVDRLLEQRHAIDLEIEVVEREFMALNLINLLTKITQQASAYLASDRSFQLDVLLEAFAPNGDDAFYEDQKIENRELLDLARKAVATEEGRMVLREALVRGLLELKNYESVATYIKHKASL